MFKNNTYYDLNNDERYCIYIGKDISDYYETLKTCLEVLAAKMRGK